MISGSLPGGFGRGVKRPATSDVAGARLPRRSSNPVAVGMLMIETCAVAAGLLLSGCGRKSTNAQPPPGQGSPEAIAQAPVSAAAAPVNPAAPVDVQEKQRLAQAVAMREGKAPPPPTMTLRGGEPATPEVLAAYNSQLAQLIFKYRDAPETLDELVRRWPMPRLPTAPPGKRIVYDARNRVIALYPP